MSLKQAFPLFIVLLALGIGYFGAECGLASECFASHFLKSQVFTVYKPVWIFSLYSLPAVGFLPFIRSNIFKTWLKFSLIWVGVSILFIVTTPESMTNGLYISWYAKFYVAQSMGVLFSAATLILIPVAYLAQYSRSKGFR